MDVEIQADLDVKRRNFLMLDGVRGVAALSVVSWHVQGWKPLSSAYLAVDLFFIISGFVIAYRYEDRLRDTRQIRSFVVKRLVRLYPLFVLGHLLGAAFVFGRLYYSGANAGQTFRWLLDFVLGIVCLPDLDGPRGFVFPFNVPAWSLFYELVINLVYALVAPYLGHRSLLLTVGASALGIGLAVLWHGDLQFSGVMPLFLLGSIRVVFGFFVGVAIFRLWALGLVPLLRLHPMLIIISTVLMLSVPSRGLIAEIATILIVLVGFPLLVASALESEPGKHLAPIVRWLGVMSFPLYAVHFPVVVALTWALSHLLPQAVLLALIFPTTLSAAWLSNIAFDVPIRSALAHLFAERHKAFRSTRW